jgi:hypothetical protein
MASVLLGANLAVGGANPLDPGSLQSRDRQRCAFAAAGGRVESPSKRKRPKARQMPKNAVRTHPQLHAVLGGSSLPCSITEENHATAKAPFAQKLELQSDVVREGLFAASHDDRHEEQMTLIDQS